DSLDELPLVQINYNIEKTGNRILKRGFDLVLSFLLLISVYPFVYWKKRVRGKSRSRFILMLPSVFSGRYSFVGPPAGGSLSHDASSTRGNGGVGSSLNLGRPGLTGLVQLQGNRSLTVDELEQYNLYYAKNQSVALDTEILLKAMVQRNMQPLDAAPLPESPVQIRRARGRRKGKGASTAPKGSAHKGV
ncbi:MAG: sugar transferase, partial [Bacteroidota bacterium]